jgi:hypothetical protein
MFADGSCQLLRLEFLGRSLGATRWMGFQVSTTQSSGAPTVRIQTALGTRTARRQRTTSGGTQKLKLQSQMGAADMELPSLGDFYWPVIGTLAGTGILFALLAIALLARLYVLRTIEAEQAKYDAEYEADYAELIGERRMEQMYRGEL